MSINRRSKNMILEKLAGYIKTESRAVKENWVKVDNVDITLNQSSFASYKGDGLERNEVRLIGVLRGVDLEEGKYRFIDKNKIYEAINPQKIGNKTIITLKIIKGN